MSQATVSAFVNGILKHRVTDHNLKTEQSDSKLYSNSVYRIKWT